jgi:hypothetical protein
VVRPLLGQAEEIGLLVGAQPTRVGRGLHAFQQGASSSSLVKIRLARDRSASLNSLVIVRARVGQASMHIPQKIQRK